MDEVSEFTGGTPQPSRVGGHVLFVFPVHMFRLSGESALDLIRT